MLWIWLVLSVLAILVGVSRGGGAGAVTGLVVSALFLPLMLVGQWIFGGPSHCEEYGYPDLSAAGRGETCSDEEIQTYVEQHSP